MDLQKAVFEALDNAKANGYDQAHVDATLLAVDMKDCDADLADVPIAELLPHIKAWQANQ
jgi:hypothetical protein